MSKESNEDESVVRMWLGLAGSNIWFLWRALDASRKTPEFKATLAVVAFLSSGWYLSQ
jgi:hypothetical protein